MRKKHTIPASIPSAGHFNAFKIDKKVTHIEEISEYLRYTESLLGKIDDQTKSLLINNYRMIIDIHAHCLVQSIGEACTIYEIPVKKKG